jgi:hypothetical protein
MQTLAERISETTKTRMWQKVYDKGFVDALEKGMALDEACDAGDSRVLTTFEAMLNLPED